MPLHKQQESCDFGEIGAFVAERLRRTRADESTDDLQLPRLCPACTAIAVEQLALVTAALGADSLENLVLLSRDRGTPA